MTQTQYDTFEDGIGLTTLESDRGAIDNVQEDSPIAVSGVVIPENTVLEGGLGEPHFYTPQLAERASEVLQRQIDDEETTVHIVKNFHDTEGQAAADDIIGEVTGAGYSKGIGTVFEGEVMDEDIAQKINLGYLDISPSVARSLGPLDETMNAREVDDVAGFRDIATVGSGQPGSDVQVGPNPAVEALSRAMDFDTLDDDDESTPDDPEPMSLDEAKEKLADEHDMDVSELETLLADGGEDDTDDRVVRLVEPS